MSGCPDGCAAPGCRNVRAMASAILDATRAYRYRLERIIGHEPKTALFVMLNPSTADETTDDPTIRRCIAFAKREGCGRLLVCNLYALRATNPTALLTAQEPCGDNEPHIRQAAAEADLIVAAWGANHLGGPWPARVLSILSGHGKAVYALRVLVSGNPGHPLYVAADAPLKVFQGLEAVKPWGSRHLYHGGAPDA